MARGGTTKEAKSKLAVAAITHEDAHRKNIPTAELESVMKVAEKTPVRVTYEQIGRASGRERV